MDWFEASEGYQEDSEMIISSKPPLQDGVSFEKLEQYELNQTLQLLIATDERLYDDSLVVEAKMVTKEDITPRYYSEGYEANYEGVSDAEIKKWQEHFPYLMLVGKSIQGLGAEVSSRDVVNTGSELVEHYFEDTGINASTVDLTVEGQGMHIYPMHIDDNMVPIGSGEEGYEEIIEQDGILEEVLAIDIDPSHTENNNLEEHEQLEDMKKEIWASVVDRLRPLVQQALEYADKNNVPSSMVELDAEKSKNNFEDDNDDDGW
ncbi:hypothetical protein EON65_06435 [archaeon]|nr:MAG: hypothetical protein EON65_06435 [archaeon]